MEMQDKKGELDALLVQLEYISQEIKALELQMNEIRKVLEELSILKVGLKNLKGAETGEEILVPLSSGVYAKAKLEDPSKVLVNIGADVFVFKTVEEALPLVEKQIKKLEEKEKSIIELITKLRLEYQKILDRVAQLRKKQVVGVA